MGKENGNKTANIEKELFDICRLNELVGRAALSSIFAKSSILKKAYHALVDVSEVIIELEENK